MLVLFFLLAALELMRPAHAAAARPCSATQCKYTITSAACCNTLTDVAIINGMTLNAVIALNPQITNPSLVYPGDQACLTCDPLPGCPAATSIACTASRNPAVSPGQSSRCYPNPSSSNVLNNAITLSNSVANPNNVDCGSYTRTWSSGCGQRCVQTVTVRDTTPPSITCPGTLTINCGQSIPTSPSATCSDSCSSCSITRNSPPATCGTTQTRVWTATDSCSNRRTCNQQITIRAAPTRAPTRSPTTRAPTTRSPTTRAPTTRRPTTHSPTTPNPSPAPTSGPTGAPTAGSSAPSPPPARCLGEGIAGIVCDGSFAVVRGNAVINSAQALDISNITFVGVNASLTVEGSCVNLDPSAQINLNLTALPDGNVDLLNYWCYTGAAGNVSVNVEGLPECEMVLGSPMYTPTTFSVSISRDSSACGLPVGAIVGIAIGVVALAVVAIALPLYLRMRANDRQTAITLSRIAK